MPKAKIYPNTFEKVFKNGLTGLREYNRDKYDEIQRILGKTDPNSQAEKVESGWVGGQGELGMCYSVGIDAFRKMLVS